MQLFDAGDRHPILDAQVGELFQPALEAKPVVRRLLERPLRVAAGHAQVLLGGADLVERARDEPVAHLARLLERAELALQVPAHLAQPQHAQHRGEQQPGEQPREPDHQQAGETLVRPAPGHGAHSVTRRPLRTTAMVIGLSGTSPLSSNAIRPVTPSYACRLRPTCAR